MFGGVTYVHSDNICGGGGALVRVDWIVHQIK